MASHRLVDSYGRVADDLRISVTDRCNFRCIYCMPAEGLKWLAREDILRYEEIVRLARIFVERYGVRTIRITGGEPLVRVKLEELIGMINAIDPTLDITMTTNGVLLRQKAPAPPHPGADRGPVPARAGGRHATRAGDPLPVRRRRGGWRRLHLLGQPGLLHHLQPSPTDGRGRPANVPLLAARDPAARPDALGRLGRSPRIGDRGRDLAQRGGPPHQQAGIHQAGQEHVPDRGRINPDSPDQPRL